MTPLIQKLQSLRTPDITREADALLAAAVRVEMDAYLNGKIASASKAWSGIDADSWLEELRGTENPHRSETDGGQTHSQQQGDLTAEPSLVNTQPSS